MCAVLLRCGPGDAVVACYQRRAIIMPGLLLYSSSCLVYCSTPTDLNLVNFEIFTEGISHTAEIISIFDTSG